MLFKKEAVQMKVGDLKKMLDACDQDAEVLLYIGGAEEGGFATGLQHLDGDELYFKGDPTHEVHRIENYVYIKGRL
jgi:hypothetical protein